MKLTWNANLLITGLTLPIATEAQVITVGDPGAGVLNEEYELSSGSIAGARVYDQSTFIQMGGSVGSALLYMYDQSTGSMSGGTGDILYTLDSSTFSISGGTTGLTFHFGQSTFNFSGGNIVEVRAYDDSTLNMSGGSTSAAVARDDSIFNMSGGSVGVVSLAENGMFNMSGGNITNRLQLAGNANVTITGTHFGGYAPGTYDLDGLALTQINAQIWGDVFDIAFGDGSTSSFQILASRNVGSSPVNWTGTVTFIAVPEPGSIAALAVMGMVGVIALRTRLRAQQG